MHSRSTTAHGIAAALRNALHAGRWPPGAALRQEELASEFGVSRIPVREALGQLQAEGLVVIEPHRGAFVAGFTEAEMREVFDLRVLLEGEALKHAVPQHTPRSLRQLKAIQQELDAEDEVAAWAHADRAFHEVLYAPCARLRTLGLIASLRGSVERFYLSRLSPGSRREGWHDEHHRIIDAVEARDARLAVRLLTQHLRETEALAVAALAASST